MQWKLRGDCRAEFIPVNDQTALVAIVAHLAGDHFDGHADFDGGIVHIGELGGDHGTLIQFDQGDGVGGIGVEPAGGFIDVGVGIHLALAAEGIELPGFIAAVRADVARGEDFGIAMRADLTDQPVALLDRKSVV